MTAIENQLKRFNSQEKRYQIPEPGYIAQENRQLS